MLTEEKSKLSVEDASYMLKTLEEEAYAGVVSALRAQGPLTEYKSALLDHLRSALFIPLIRHKVEIRRATNDDILIEIAKRLNPLSDPYLDWSAEGESPGSLFPSDSDPKIRFLSPGQQAARILADKLALKAVDHNRQLPAGHQALFDLLELPKNPVVPEAVRFMLMKGPPKAELKKTGENDSSKSGKSAKTKLSAKLGENEEITSTSAVSNSDPSSRSGTPSSLPDGAAGKSPLDASENPPPPKAPKISQSADIQMPGHNRTQPVSKRFTKMKSSAANKGTRHQTIQHLDQQRHIKQEPGEDTATPRPRQLNVRSDSVMRCARVEPFIFEPTPHGSTQKPPRGNPDKRIKKHPVVVPGFKSPPVTRNVPLASPLNATGASAALLTGGSPSGFKKRRGPPPRYYEEMQLAEGKESMGHVDDYVYTSMSKQREPPRRPAELSGAHLSRAISANSGRYPPYYGSSVLAQAATARIAAPPAPTAAVQAAYSSPTRPYYGNPSAAAMGITVRPMGDGAKPVVSIPSLLDTSTTSSQSLYSRQYSSSSVSSARGPVPRPAPVLSTSAVSQQNMIIVRRPIHSVTDLEDVVDGDGGHHTVKVESNQRQES